MGFSLLTNHSGKYPRSGKDSPPSTMVLTLEKHLGTFLKIHTAGSEDLHFKKVAGDADAGGTRPVWESPLRR